MHPTNYMSSLLVKLGLNSLSSFVEFVGRYSDLSFNIGITDEGLRHLTGMKNLAGVVHHECPHCTVTPSFLGSLVLRPFPLAPRSTCGFRFRIPTTSRF